MPRSPMRILLSIVALAPRAVSPAIALGPDTSAYALSADGSTVAGPRASGSFRWTLPGGVQPLLLPSGTVIQSLSADGSVVIGQSAPLAAFRYDGLIIRL